MVHFLIVAAAFVAPAIATTPLSADCPELVVDKAVSISVNQQACVTVVVVQGEAAQVIVQHAEDASLRVINQETKKETLADGFEFGQETITLSSAGQYQILASIVGSKPESPDLSLNMSRTSVPLQAAADWQAAEALAATSKHSATVPNILSSLGHWQGLQQPSAIARTWLKLGDLVLSSGDLNRAYDAYEHALEVCRSIRDKRCTAEAANNSGYVAQQLGNLPSSSARLDEAIEEWRELALPLNEGKTLSNLGIVYSRAGDFQQAISTYDHASTILKPLDSLAYARVQNNLGLSYLALAQYAEAKTYFQKAIAAEAKLHGAKGDWLRARLNFGRTLMLQNRLEEARSLIEDIVAKTEKLPDRSLHAFALNNLGQTLFRLGLAHANKNYLELTKAAESRLGEALDLHRTLGDKRGQAIAEHYLGLIASHRGDLAAARKLLNEALDIRQTCGLRDDAADSLFALAELEFASGDSARAQTLTQEAIPLLESIRNHVPGAALRASFYARRRNLLDLLVAIAMRPANPNAVRDGLIAAELGRSRALLDIVSERELSSPKPPELMKRQAKIRREINYLSRIAADERKESANIGERMQALIAEDEQVEASILQEFEDREPGARPLASVASLQRELRWPQSAILEYHLGERNSYLWVITDQAIDVFTLPPRDAIERQISSAIGLFGTPRDRLNVPALEKEFLQAMDRLSRTLLGNLQSRKLPPLLLLVLDGNLHRVPFAALRFSTGEYLGLGHDLVRIPSAAFLQHGSRQNAAPEFPKSILAVYDPVFSSEDGRVPPALRGRIKPKGTPLPRLPFTEELQTITQLVPGSRRDFLSGFNANAPTLENMGLDQYGILHLSTHAIIDDDIPELSRIALSVMDRKGRPIDGFLFPYQLANLHLRSSVVVLSACKTALGQNVLGEGLAGFSSSLFSAGATQLVLTISDVDAQASSVFMSRVYRRVLARHPESMQHALTLTRRSFLHSQWSDPYYWASFVLIGMPASNISGQEKRH